MVIPSTIKRITPQHHYHGNGRLSFLLCPIWASFLTLLMTLWNKHFQSILPLRLRQREVNQQLESQTAAESVAFFTRTRVACRNRSMRPWEKTGLEDLYWVIEAIRLLCGIITKVERAWSSQNLLYDWHVPSMCHLCPCFIKLVVTKSPTYTRTKDRCLWGIAFPSTWVSS